MRKLLAILVLVIAGLTITSVAGAATSTTCGCAQPSGRLSHQRTRRGHRDRHRGRDAGVSAGRRQPPERDRCHIHRTSTGAGVALLYEATSPVDVHGTVVLASGTITAADLMEPTLTVEQLAAELLAGTSFYVNVHTSECPNGAISGELLVEGGH